MKNFVLFILLSFFIEGVFGESVSVTNGDSVTLHTGLTEIQKDDVLEWRFGTGLRIARVRKGSDPTTYDDVLDGIFRGRLKLDGQTGDLTITNITAEHAGPYNMSINAIASRTFSVIGVSGVDEVKSVSVIVGDSVTLNSGTIILRDDVIEWRFVDLNSLIAENNRKTGDFSTSDVPDGRFRDRLKLDYTTGSLTIRKIGTKHTGVYEAVIRKSSSTHTIHKSYSVTASGKMKSVSVMKGDSVTLNTGLTEIQTTDLMQWMFGDTVLAEIIKAQQRFSTSDDPDGRFRDRLKLDPQTGSLTITDTRFTDSGEYELKIISSRFIINKRITVTLTGPGLSPGAIAGISVAVLLACVAAVAGLIYHRHKTSELEEHASVIEETAAELKERLSELKEQARGYTWTILSVMEGETITLKPDEVDEEYITLNPDDDDEVHKDDRLLWMFRSTFIAVRESGADRFTVHDDVLHERFRDRLKLDDKTGSLTITHTRNTDSGVYELLIIRPGKSSIKRFSVSVFVKTADIEQVSVEEGGSVTLKTGVTDIQKDEQILWRFGLDTPLAEITGGTKKISPFADEIFEGRLKIDHKTGSLTIKKIRPTDAGIYMLYIIEEDLKTKFFRVKVLENKPEENAPLNRTDFSLCEPLNPV